MNVENEFKEILSELKEQTKWLKFLVLPKLKKIIQETLVNKEQKIIYELSDGINSTHEISKKLSEENIEASHMKVLRYWGAWASLGIVIPSKNYTGRYVKIISLKDLDIE